MIIKTFSAESAAAALKLVRAELGKDAVVLKTREVSTGRGRERIEVTACLDGPAPERPSAAEPASPRLANVRPFQPATLKSATAPAAANTAQPVTTGIPATHDGLADLAQRIASLEQKIDRLVTLGGAQGSVADSACATIRHALRNADVSEDLISELVAAAADAGTVRNRLTEKLGGLMQANLSFTPGDRVVFLGCAGAGKSSLLGKLAAKLVFHEKQAITLTTLDSVKIGAFEELHSYADILGANAIDHKQLQGKVRRDVISLIDTPGLPRSAEQQELLREQVRALNPTHRIAVISALTRSADVLDMAERFGAFAPTHVALTMTDLTERWGVVLAACESLAARFVFVTNSPAGIGTLNVPDPALFVRTLLAGEGGRD